MPFKLIFMGTPMFSVPILKLLNSTKHEIIAVYTQPPKKKSRGQKIEESPVHLESTKLNIPVRYPESLDNDKEFNFIKNAGIHVVIVSAYGQIIPKKILDIPNIIFLNIHASLLPKWRGAAPIQRSIIEMDKETGISIMKIVPKLDAGPYMLQEKFKIEEKDNYSTVSNKLSILGAKLINESLNLLSKGEYKFIPQNESKKTYAKKVDKKESEIKWNIPAKNLIAKINGLNPFPGVWFKHKNTRLKIIQAVETDKSGKEGEILDDKLTIACRRNSIKIILIQKEGKKILSVKDFLTGYKIKKGDILS
tara:strand:- start:1304 stop:2224 length:921 start_codon:yes stop_codon:yes gene_type:complete